MNAWSHLPNAQHIDRVIESVKSYHKVWTETNANFNVSTNTPYYEDYHFYLYKARLHSVKIIQEFMETHFGAWHAARDAAYEAAYRANKKQIGAKDAARISAWDAITALVAHDDAAKYLSMTPDTLKTWAFISNDPSAILLLPTVTAFEQINKQKNLNTNKSLIKYILNYIKS